MSQPHHPYDCHGDAEPVEEAEEVYDGEDVVGEGVEERHRTLNRVREKQFSVQCKNVCVFYFHITSEALHMHTSSVTAEIHEAFILDA